VRRVVKVGGSLLLRHSLKRQLEHWLRTEALAETFVVVGGGPVVDAIRRRDEVYPGDPTGTHWQCIELLEISWAAAARGLGWATVANEAELQAALTDNTGTMRPLLVAVKAFYDRRHADAVPTDWRTTSDTIAALLALHIAADELVLLKSCPIPAEYCLDQLAAVGIVDGIFPSAAERVPSVQVVQLQPDLANFS